MRLFYCTSIFLVTLLVSISGFCAAGSQYIPPSSPVSSIIGNWARTYQVSSRNGDMHWQMEIYSFAVGQKFSAYYYTNGKKEPFKKRFGHYAIEEPLLQLTSTDKIEVEQYNAVWKDCNVVMNQLSCKGYHDEWLPFTKWDKRPDRLDQPCCPQAGESKD